jgi:hypothetical protein
MDMRGRFSQFLSISCYFPSNKVARVDQPEEYLREKGGSDVVQQVCEYEADSNLHAKQPRSQGYTAPYSYCVW